MDTDTEDAARFLNGLRCEVVQGFVWRPGVLHSRQIKHVGCSLHLRVAALAAEEWPPAYAVIAEAIGCSERTVRNYFPRWEGLYAFPPPEMAVAIVAATTGIDRYCDVPDALIPLFEALDANPFARAFLTALVNIRAAHPELRKTDNYFAVTMREQLAERDGELQPHHAILTAHFTEVLRVALRDWTLNPNCTATHIITSLHIYLDHFTTVLGEA